MTGPGFSDVDFDLRYQGPGAAPPPPRGISLAELIAEEKRAWDAETPVRAQADLLYFAWRDAHPKLDIKIEDEEALPAPMGDLYRQANGLQATASGFADRICGWVPGTLAEAVALLAWFEAGRRAEDALVGNVLAGLRALAAPEAEEPAGTDDRIVSLFREWRAAWRATATAAIDDGEECERRCAALNALERRVFDAPADGARGLAIKAFMAAHLHCAGALDDGEPRLDGFNPEIHYDGEGRLLLDHHALKGLVESLAEFLPEVAPLCAAVLAAPVSLPSGCSSAAD